MIQDVNTPFRQYKTALYTCKDSNNNAHVSHNAGNPRHIKPGVVLLYCATVSPWRLPQNASIAL